MIEVISISLENEMDLVLAHKRSMKVAEKLGLTVATQTTFATAVSDVSRTVIEYTDNGSLVIGLIQNKTRYALIALVSFESETKLTAKEEGFFYAQKLVPEFELTTTNGISVVQMQMGLPRSLKLDPVKIGELRKYFKEQEPLNPYEEIKRRNLNLHKIAEEQELEIRQSKVIDEKKTEFISVASHEIKTPMTILKAYTQMAKATKEPLSDHLRGVLDKIDQQSNKLITLVQQLLDISRMENGNLQYSKNTVSFNNFITEQLTVMRHILPYHEVFSELGDDVDVLIDTLRLEQVFSNLLGNAAKYSSRQTAIRLTTKIEADGYVLVAITDEGKGISGENLQSIFNKFYREKDVLTTHAGLGMGLYITSKIVTDHGGRIWAESSAGEGSTFYFTLPPVKA
ncbi:ATP-binding protein [Mucilaginibacter segetis]|uniref:histidine kinase n=1 Tax=Mucilaginibacter segetis TaxID=2793071 RepID=A0A934PTF6_9SPHI|nr:sensor histidine kinase [Mucilaginibacter segetis]MBK0379709.1 sensor histidine kinase [Mucilaginibacter segetis]